VSEGRWWAGGTYGTPMGHMWQSPKTEANADAANKMKYINFATI